MQQTKESKEKDAKTRVFALAKELHLETKVLLEFCKELGYAGIKNQLNVLEPEQVDALKVRAKKGPKTAASPPPPAPSRPAVPPKLDSKIPTLTAKPKTIPAARPTAPPPPPPAETEAEPTPKEIEPAPAPVADAPVAEREVPPTPTPAPTPEPEPQASEAASVVADEPPAAEAMPDEESTPASPPPAAMMPRPSSGGRIPTMSGGRPTNLNPQRPTNLNTQRPATQPPPRPTPPASTPPASTPPAAGPGAPRPPAGNIPHRPAPHGPSGQRPAPTPSAGGPGGHRPGGPGGPGQSPGHRGPGGMPPRHGPTGSHGPAPHGPAGPAAGGRPAPPRPPAKGHIKLTSEQIDRLRKLEQSRGQQRASIQDIQRIVADQPGKDPAAPEPGAATGRPGRGAPHRGPAAPAARPEETEDDRRGGGPKKPGEVAGRDARHKSRQAKGGGRDRGPSTDRGSIIIGAGGRVDTIEERFGSRIKKHRGHRHQQRQSTLITGKVEIAVPITVRSLSEAIGMKVNELILKLKSETNSLYMINSNVEFDVAELIATEKSIELVAKKQETAEDIVLREIEERVKAREEHLIPRPPIVTIMGHVDHGKTSLLDKIRQEYGIHSDVVSTETGGITQVLRAWRVEKDGHPITFLDTPGHEAFTKMRARGANVTDIAVIVVSAADGIMPQTQEAVAHAKAADVDIIVAINKCDLPGAQPEKVKGRLYEMELVPEDMGGDVPVIFTSAITGQGIGELLDNIALRAEFAELKADPDQPATGTCLEAYQSADEGVMATLLVGNGTIHKGDVLLCGSTFGKVRAMYNDLGVPIESAGPSSPVRVTGLSTVPDADDPFYILDDITTAREIAEKRRDIRQEAERVKFSPVSLDKLREATSKTKITELKVILKAEARGSVEAIKKELEKLVHEEVRTRVLHAGIGAITESDVTLALTSPADTLIVGFNVTSDDAALKLAEQRGVNVREYQIIYNLVDDIKAALEGRLKPVEEVVHLGRAVVRETFRISKVGTIAGCYVTSGVIERNSKVRVIREGAVIYPPAEKVASLDNLKRFKDDVKEVREGFECGMKLAGFDDIKVGDVIEAFKIEIRQRTL